MRASCHGARRADRAVPAVTLAARWLRRYHRHVEIDRPQDEALGGLRDGPYDEAGVDVSLVRWMLALTPAERLAVLQGAATSLASLRPSR